MTQQLEKNERFSLPELSPSGRWVRAMLGGVFVADTRRALLLRRRSGPGEYVFHPSDVREELFIERDHEKDDQLGELVVYDLDLGGRVVEKAARRLVQPQARLSHIEGFVTFDWDAMEAWFEEDEQVYVHPRDPYHRVDARQSSRHVRVLVDGVEVASTHRPVLCFETGLRTRYYLPKTDVRMDLLTHTDTQTQCPYKGTAEYWSVNVNGTTHDDLAWSYRTPLPESQKIAGFVAFYDEKVDVYVDGVLQERPHTKFS